MHCKIAESFIARLYSIVDLYIAFVPRIDIRSIR